jgi:hypothetical protein
MELIAKPIVKNQWWVVTSNGNKVGNVELNSNGYSVKLGQFQSNFESKDSIEDAVSIHFQRPKNKKSSVVPYAIWPTTGSTHNNMYDVKRRLHVYTKSKKSKCYYAAGWFRMKLTDNWQTVFCPKYIFVQRYAYHGPFVSKEQADCG